MKCRLWAADEHDCQIHNSAALAMNYRHAFHAGNHADVLKHVVLARVIEHLKTKQKPFAVLDAHAGIGAYDLHGPQALKTGEWQSGIGKMAEAFSPEVEEILSPYRQVIAAMNAQDALQFYPGSPEIAVRLLRPHDKLIANELHPSDAQSLAQNYQQDARVRVTQRDSILAIKAELPFAARRGVVLIDPPFEVTDDTARTVEALAFGYRRFATGTFIVWYPVTTEDFATKFIAAIAALQLPNMLQIELRTKAAFERGGLAGSGLIIVNPPWTLEAELQLLMPALVTRLAIGEWGRGHINWLTPPH